MKTTRRHIVSLMAAGMVLAACSGSEGSMEVSAPNDAPQAVDFGAYINRGTTRGGYAGALSTANLRSAASDGFGVFAYYTETAPYNQMALPNFMYNQRVYDETPGAGTARWTYTPLKYWPNGEGEASGTTGLFPHYVSFFGYAPYTAVDSYGKVEDDPATDGIDESASGIISMSRTMDNGDPVVRYCASFKPAEAVDLCWSVPQMNKTKPDVAEYVNFNFYHALSALNVQIDVDNDVAVHSTTDNLPDYTHVYVRSITFEGFTTKGQLLLNSTTDTPHWNSMDCDCELTAVPVTVYDGRRNGHEGLAVSLNERPTGLNPAIIQSGAYTVTPGSPDVLTPATTGVTHEPMNLFNTTGVTGDAEAVLAAPVFVIPTNDPLRVTIEYDVETYDPKLTSEYLGDAKTHGSSIKNTLTANIMSGPSAITMVAGKQYTIKLHLGLTSVKADATVTLWDPDAKSANVDLIPVPNGGE